MTQIFVVTGLHNEFEIASPHPVEVLPNLQYHINDAMQCHYNPVNILQISVGSCYNVVQFNKVFHTTLQWLQYYIPSNL